MKKVVVAMSTYNGAKYVGAFIESIMNQTYGNIEFCIRDDGSTDGTLDIIRSWQQKDFPGKTITLINDVTGVWENMGAHPSYRFLFNHLPDADYYILCDQDDVVLPDKIERAVAAMDKYPADIPVMYAHSYYLCDGDLNVQGTLPPLHSYTPEEMKHINLAKVIMTGTWGGVGMAQACNSLLFHEAYCTPMEGIVAGDCWISWVVAGLNGAFLFDEKPLAYYRRHEGTYSSGNANGLKRYQDWKKHMRRHCDNITNGIWNYHHLFYDRVSPERQHFLKTFVGKNRLRKFFYPHRLRENLLHEIAFRILILMGKI